MHILQLHLYHEKDFFSLFPCFTDASVFAPHKSSHCRNEPPAQPRSSTFCMGQHRSGAVAHFRAPRVVCHRHPLSSRPWGTNYRLLTDNEPPTRPPLIVSSSLHTRLSLKSGNKMACGILKIVEERMLDIVLGELYHAGRKRG